MAFKAESVVEPLDWDFKPHVQAAGRTPEPTDSQIEAFMLGMRDLAKSRMSALPEIANTDGDVTAVVEALENFEDSMISELMGEMSGLYAALASNCPTKDQILGLPMRVRAQYFQWMTSEVVRPEAGNGAGNAPVPILRPVPGAPSST